MARISSTRQFIEQVLLYTLRYVAHRECAVLTSISRSSSVFIAFTLAACAQPLPYTRPIGPDAATVSLANRTASSLRAREAHREDCMGPSEFADGKPMMDAWETRTTKVNGNEFLSVNLSGLVQLGGGVGLTISACALTVGFHTRRGAQYQLEYGQAAQGCTVRAMQQVEGNWVPLRLTRLRFGATSCYPDGEVAN